MPDHGGSDSTETRDPTEIPLPDILWHESSGVFTGVEGHWYPSRDRRPPDRRPPDHFV